MPNWKTVLAALAVVASACQPVQSQDWPQQRPVKIVVPFAPGGNADGMARIVSVRFNEVFGQQFVVENRTGAGGALAVEAVARSSADGYTLLWGVQPQIVILPAMTKVPYDPVKDLVADQRARHQSVCAGGERQAAGQDGGGVRVLCPRAAGQAQLRIERAR